MKTVALVMLLALPISGLQAQESAKTREADAARVMLDGEELFRVRGVSAYPATERAAAIARAIREAANDRSFDPPVLRTEPLDFGTSLMAGTRRVMVVVDADAQADGVRHSTLAEVYAQRIGRAVREYREARTPEAVREAWVVAGVGLVVLAVAVWLVLLLWRGLNRQLERRLFHHVQALEAKSFRIVDSRRVWLGVRGLLNLARGLALLALFYVFLQVVLAGFPLTRGFAARLAEYSVGPLRTMGSAFLEFIPNLIFLVVLYYLVRTALRITKVFFESVEHGTITLANFEPEWSGPTYRIVRTIAIAFAVVVAYPFLPGSGTGAFQGVSLFLGLMISLGSGSAVANIIAGYVLTYRRAFRMDDVIRIGDKLGRVAATRMQVTHLRTAKNEELVVPNSTMLNTEVVNYSTLARAEGLILHTTVGIGYDTPWRQVEAMLLLAARRTEGVLAEPPPFVNQLSLGDFAITYEINAYCREPHRMFALYSALHRNILDVFNEHGVVIMTPAYEGDPEQPKLVPRDQWYVAPATPEKSGV